MKNSVRSVWDVFKKITYFCTVFVAITVALGIIMAISKILFKIILIIVCLLGSFGCALFWMSIMAKIIRFIEQKSNKKYN